MNRIRTEKEEFETAAKAVQDIASAIAKTMGESRRGLCLKYDLSQAQINTCISRAFVSNAVAALSGCYGLTISSDACRRLERDITSIMLKFAEEQE